MAPLLALAMAGFITILTEALPAGLLPQMSMGLGVSPSAIGQLITAYAVGSLMAAIPLTAVTQHFPRKPLLLCAIAGFAVVNTITATTGSFYIMLLARFVAGVCAGLLWAMIAGYAARMVTDQLKGRAIAVAMVGTPLALSLGIPAGTLMGSAIGWRSTFSAMTALTIALIGWVWAKVPDYSGTTISGRASIRGTLAISGIKSILTVTLLFVLAHNILYTYIAPLVVPAGLAGKLDFVLLVFGVTAIAGICIVGYLVGRWLRELVLASIVLFGAAALMLGIWGDLPELFWLATGMWGLAFGGAATLFQTTAATTSGQASDVAQSMIVTAWNLAIAGGGTIGGLLLEHSDISWLAWSVLVLLLLAYVIAFLAKDRGFPSSQSTL
ncbi:MFS transporter [Ochrobactrum sp. MYb15]|nr:MFS transporter [Ochrobactrum sp. MYb19]PRA53026.1 MFS transporter [Ochrobactrum sp. MYb68]PRA63289.1 MFS transporter [Ochrobactrum sp. MYb18]PRA73356.1 MFS transporter [Brucella thiophenivorans]PRA88283.1 MFS transporter [Ochrobactrum sp. MYb14]PRA94879.1 MFS transporter [Ochrobactrum sp. MYb15]